MKSAKSERIWRVIAVILHILICAAAGGLLYQIWALQMLPLGYFAALAAVVVLLAASINLLISRPNRGKWSKNRSWTRQVIGCILALIFLAGCGAGFYFLGTLYNTISSITSSNAVHVLLEVYVRADDPAQFIQDTAGYTFAIADSTEEEDNQDALAELQTLLGTMPETVSYATAFDTIGALYSGEVDAIILDSSYLSILDSVEGYGDFEEKARILYEHIIEKEAPKTQTFFPFSGESSSGESSDIPKNFDPSEEPFLLYISGNDARRQLLADGGSDVNILVAVNPKNHQILMVNTPRDYYVINPASGTERDKLSHCGLKGIDNCVQAMTGLYGIPIHCYARINFSGFRTLVDAIGGVTVNSPVSFTAGGHHIQKGENYLTGEQALSFARERMNLPGGDNDRGKNQMRLIEGMIKKLASGTILTNYGDIMESLEGMFTTSMSAANIGKLVQLQLSQMPDWEIYSFAVTGDNGNDICWAAGGNGYVMYPHENMVAHAKGLMEKVLSGEVITSDDLIVP